MGRPQEVDGERQSENRLVEIYVPLDEHSGVLDLDSVTWRGDRTLLFLSRKGLRLSVGVAGARVLVEG